MLLTNKSKVLSAGHGANRALGLGSSEDSFRFKKVKLLDRVGHITKIDAGLSHSSALV